MHPMEKMIYLRGKQDASYWLGLIAYQRGNYPAAIDYFTKRTLLFTPEGPWTAAPATISPAPSRPPAIPSGPSSSTTTNEASPGYLGDLLRAKWLEELKEKRKAERDEGASSGGHCSTGGVASPNPVGGGPCRIGQQMLD